MTPSAPFPFEGVKSKPVLVSFSGGRTSGLLARLIQTSPIFEGRDKHFVFANTGREREETLRFVHECDTRWNLGVVWVEAVVTPQKRKGTTHRIVSFDTAIRNTDPVGQGHPFLEVVSKYGLPSNAFPHCTRELKLRPIASYMRSVGLAVDDYETAIGIRYDEPSRIKSAPGLIYPLNDLMITEETVRLFWDRQPFDLGLKDFEGNCDLCFKKSLRKRLTILRETPSIAPFWANFEGSRVDPKGRMRPNLTFDRNGLTVGDLLKLSNDPKLEVAVDKHDQRLADASSNPAMFETLKEINWDFETSCLCQST